MLPVLRFEDDGPDAMDLHLRLVAEPHRSSGRSVQVGEELASAGHVVGCTAVQVPSVHLLSIAGVEVGARTGFFKLEAAVLGAED